MESHIIDQEYGIDEIDTTEDALIPSFGNEGVNDYGEFNIRECSTHIISHYKDHLETFDDYVDKSICLVHLNNVNPRQHDFNRLKPHFGFVPAKRIQKTIEHTTQFCRLDARLPLRKHFKSRFPAANIPRRNEIVATDTFFSNVSTHDDSIIGHGGSKMVQLYCGTTSLITAIFPMRNESEMPSTLLDFICKLGAPNFQMKSRRVRGISASVFIGKTAVMRLVVPQ